MFFYISFFNELEIEDFPEKEQQYLRTIHDLKDELTQQRATALQREQDYLRTIQELKDQLAQQMEQGWH